MGSGGAPSEDLAAAGCRIRISLGSRRCYALPTVALPRCRTAAAPLPHCHRGQRAETLLGLGAHRTHIAHIFGACGGVINWLSFCGESVRIHGCVQNRCSFSSLLTLESFADQRCRAPPCLALSPDSPHSQTRTPTRCPASPCAWHSLQFIFVFLTNETCDGNATCNS